MSQVKQVRFQPRFKTVHEELSSTVLGNEFQTAGADKFHNIVSFHVYIIHLYYFILLFLLKIYADIPAVKEF